MLQYTMILWVNIVVADGLVPVWRQDLCNHDDVSQWEQLYLQRYTIHTIYANPDSKVHRANVGPTWVLSAPDGPHVGPMKLAIREDSKWFHIFVFSAGVRSLQKTPWTTLASAIPTIPRTLRGRSPGLAKSGKTFGLEHVRIHFL